MENWEKELRERLEKELPEGAYEVGVPGGITLWTGKGGKIDCEVAFHREAMKIVIEGDTKEFNDVYKPILEEDFRRDLIGYNYGLPQLHELTVEELIKRFEDVLTGEEIEKLRKYHSENKKAND